MRNYWRENSLRKIHFFSAARGFGKTGGWKTNKSKTESSTESRKSEGKSTKVGWCPIFSRFARFLLGFGYFAPKIVEICILFFKISKIMKTFHNPSLETPLTFHLGQPCVCPLSPLWIIIFMERKFSSVQTNPQSFDLSL